MALDLLLKTAEAMRFDGGQSLRQRFTATHGYIFKPSPDSW